MMSAGQRLRAAVEQHRPLAVVGAVNAYAALLAEHAGHHALYLSGGGVAASSIGVPDLGITTMEDVLTDARRITAVTELPLLADADTGWGSAFNIARTVREFDRAGVAGLHIEDQVQAKRCGHRPNKAIVTQSEMVDRIKAAVDARTDDSFVIMARTDAVAIEGMDRAIERAIACVEAGADMVFPEALGSLADYERFVAAVPVPVLANITEFGKTPLFSQAELGNVGVRLVLYPLSAFRAMSKAAFAVYTEIANSGSQVGVVDSMQTREELYQHLDYYEYERRLDALFSEEQ